MKGPVEVCPVKNAIQTPLLFIHRSRRLNLQPPGGGLHRHWNEPPMGPTPVDVDCVKREVGLEGGSLPTCIRGCLGVNHGGKLHPGCICHLNQRANASCAVRVAGHVELKRFLRRPRWKRQHEPDSSQANQNCTNAKFPPHCFRR